MADDRDPVKRPDYADFELQIGRGKARIYPIAVRSLAGSLQRSMRFLTPRALNAHLLKLENAVIRSSGSYRVTLGPEQKAVQAFGQDLFEAALPAEARTLYYESQREAELQGRGQRLRLRIESPELARLPWEFLYDPRSHQFVGLSSNTPIVRDLGLEQPIEPLRVEPPIRILGMIASPSGVVSLDVVREKQRMEDALKQLVAQGIVTLDWLPGQTWRELQQVLRQQPFHIFHFVGHGGFDSNREEGFLLLADDQGEPLRLRATELAILLHDAAALRLVVLNSCDTALSEGNDLFASTASILIRQGDIPAVLAMQFAISDTAAIEFSRAFYDAIAEGIPVDIAVAEARKAIRLAITDTLEWATPVLYQRSPDGVLFSLNRPVASGAVLEPEGRADLAPKSEPLEAAVPPASRSVAKKSAADAPDFLKRAAAIAAALTTIIGLFVALARFLPQESPKVEVALGNIAVSEPNITLQKFLTERGKPTDGIDAATLSSFGNAFSFEATFTGLKDKACYLYWTMYHYDDVLGHRSGMIEDNYLRNQPAYPYEAIKPDHDEDSAYEEIWVPLPPRLGRFVIELKVFEGEPVNDQLPVKMQDSEPFPLRQPPQNSQTVQPGA